MNAIPEYQPSTNRPALESSVAERPFVNRIALTLPLLAVAAAFALALTGCMGLGSELNPRAKVDVAQPTSMRPVVASRIIST